MIKSYKESKMKNKENPKCIICEKELNSELEVGCNECLMILNEYNTKKSENKIKRRKNEKENIN